MGKMYVNGCLDCEIEKAFLKAFRGKSKGALDRGVKKKILDGLKAVKIIYDERADRLWEKCQCNRE